MSPNRIGSKKQNLGVERLSAEELIMRSGSKHEISMMKAYEDGKRKQSISKD